jgi:ElaB/YqjD/DUF883 family membrane-anchored ribosome-binding protein
MNILDTNNTKDAVQNFRQTSEAVLHQAEQAVESTGSLATDALKQVDAKLNTMREHIDPVVDLMAVTAQKLAKQSMDMASDAKVYAQHAMNRASKASSQYVAEQPVRSVLMAAAIGAAVAVVITSMRSHSHTQRF